MCIGHVIESRVNDSTYAAGCDTNTEGLEGA